MYKYKGLQEGQLLREHLSFLQYLLNFIITKYLKQEVVDDLSICVDECSPSSLCITRDKDLLMSRDKKVMVLLPPMKKCPIDFYHQVAFTAQI